jgi:hypothetical protein
MTKISEQYHIIEERDGKYFDRVVCNLHNKAIEILKQVGGSFLIVATSEVENYLFTQKNSDDSIF